MCVGIFLAYIRRWPSSRLRFRVFWKAGRDKITEFDESIFDFLLLLLILQNICIIFIKSGYISSCMTKYFYQENIYLIKIIGIGMGFCTWIALQIMKEWWWHFWNLHSISYSCPQEKKYYPWECSCYESLSAVPLKQLNQVTGANNVPRGCHNRSADLSTVIGSNPATPDIFFNYFRPWCDNDQFLRLLTGSRRWIPSCVVVN